MGRVTSLRNEGDEHKARFAKLKKMFLDGTINEETPLILYFEPDLRSESGLAPADVIMMNVGQFEVLTYLELIKTMVMRRILNEEPPQ